MNSFLANKQAFKLESNFDVYCWLKSTLPSEYHVQAEPQVGYYSEWFYEYQVYRHNKLIVCFTGNFKDLLPNQLVQEVKTFLQKLGDIEC